MISCIEFLFSSMTCLVGFWNYRMLMWEDGFCRRRAAECVEGPPDGEDPVKKVFSKMSIQLYNYGEGWVLGRFLLKKRKIFCKEDMKFMSWLIDVCAA